MRRSMFSETQSVNFQILSSRYQKHTFSVWCKYADSALLSKIHDTIKRVLQLPNTFQIKFKKHDQARTEENVGSFSPGNFNVFS